MNGWVEYKLVNATSRAAERREQVIQDRLMSRLERPFAVRIARILDKTSKAAASAVEKGGKNASLKAIIKRQESELLKIFRPQYAQTIKVFGKRILDSFKSCDGYEIKAEDDFAAATAKWIQTESAKTVKDISETTEKRIRSAIAFTFESGAGTAQAAANEILSRTGGGVSKRRALTIAQTETHKASTFGSQTAAESTGVEMRKVWISAADERTRETHTQTDSRSHSKPVDLDDEFVVGGDSMTAPGLGSDPAENVNCRCVVGFRTKK